MNKLKLKYNKFKYDYKTEVSTYDKMSTKEIASCGMVEMGDRGIGQLKSGFYNVFLAAALGLKATDIAILLSVMTAIGYIKGPITSLIVDNTRTRWGRFKPYVVVTMPICIILTYAFFLNPFSDAYTAKLVYVYCVEIALSIIGGFTSWGYMKLCITRNDQEKSRFMSLAKVLGSIMGMVPGAMPILMDLFPNVSLRILFIIVASVLFPLSLGLVLTAHNITERIVLPRRDKTISGWKDLVKNFKLIFKNKYIMINWMGKIGNIFNYVADIAIAYVFMYCYGMYSWLTVVWIAGGISEWTLLFFSKKIIGKLGSKRVIIIYKAMMAASMIVLYSIGYGTTIFYLMVPVVCRFFGASFEYCEGIATNMFETDIWDHYEWKYGVRNEATTDLIGSYVSMPLTFIGPILYAYSFNKIGFVEGENAVQSEATKQGLFFLYTIGIALGFILDIIPYLLIRLDKKTMDIVHKELRERKLAKEAAERGAPVYTATEVSAAGGDYKEIEGIVDIYK